MTEADKLLKRYKSKREYRIFARNNLLNSYIKRHLRKTKGLKAKQCTPRIIEKTRQRLIELRKNREINKKLSTDNKCKCTSCKKIKPRDMFYKANTTKCGIKRTCKECCYVYDKTRSRAESRLKAEKKYRKKIIKNLEDVYLGALIANGTSLKRSDVPQYLIKAKRQFMKMKRITK